MRPVSLIAALLALTSAACRMSDDAFVDKFVEADCAYLMECSSDPVLAFQGWETIEDCMADRGPEVAYDVETCDYNKVAAGACVKAIEEQTCAAEGEDREFPAICQDVLTNCSDDDSGTDTDTEMDSDTEAAAQ